MNANSFEVQDMFNEHWVPFNLSKRYDQLNTCVCVCVCVISLNIQVTWSTRMS
jgi:hypothetical protein